MNRPQATPNKPHKTDWLELVGLMVVLNIIGYCLAGGAGRQVAIEQAHAPVPAEVVALVVAK